MSLINILFIVVMLHLAVGFGYVVYKLEFEGKNKKTKRKKTKKNKTD